MWPMGLLFLSLLVSKSDIPTNVLDGPRTGGGRCRHFFLHLYFDPYTALGIVNLYRRALGSTSPSTSSSNDNSSSTASFSSTASSPYREDGWKPPAANTGDDTSTRPGMGDDIVNGAGAFRGC